MDAGAGGGEGCRTRQACRRRLTLGVQSSVDSRLGRQPAATKAVRAGRTTEGTVARAAWWFLAPALLLIGVFFFLPVAASLLLSVTDFDIYAVSDLGNARFVGMRNYTALLDNPLFWTALQNTFYFALIGGPLTVAVSLGAALLVNAKAVRFRTFFRTVYFIPFVTTLVAVAIVWRYLYQPQYGLLNYALGLFGVNPIDWLGDPRWAMPAIILLAVWKNFGYNMLIFIAGLQSIPHELYEAAHIDGAGLWQRFRHVTIPLLTPTIFFNSVLGIISALSVFTIAYVGTKGGPANATYFYVLHIYNRGFLDSEMGYASAMAWVFFLLVMGFTALQFWAQKHWVHYDGGGR